jgi:hypothetical protein
MNFAHEFRRWNFNGLRCRNQLQKMRAVFDAEARIALLFLWSLLRERKRFRATRTAAAYTFPGRKVAYPTSPQNLGANVFSPSPSRAAAICPEGSFGDMSGLEKRRYLTLRQNWAHSCRAQSCGLGWLKTEIQTGPLPRAVIASSLPAVGPTLMDETMVLGKAKRGGWPGLRVSARTPVLRRAMPGHD